MNETWAWLILISLCLLGLLGTLLPGLPGAVLIVVGALIFKLMIPGAISWPTLLVLAALAFVSYLSDLVGTLVGAKWGGASRYGLIGAAIGGLLGLAFLPIGLFLGPLLGAMAGELFFVGKKFPEAVRAGMGALLGMAFASVARLALASVMVAVAIVAAIA